MIQNDNPLEALVGEEINAVCFVIDYVELHFNGPILRALTNPLLEFKGEKHEFPLSGSRDDLCSMIGTEAKTFSIQEDSFIEMRTRAGHVLTVPLDHGSRMGPEAAHFLPGTHATARRYSMYIW